MSIRIDNYSIALVRLTIADITTPPIFAVFADLQGVETDHNVVIPRQLFLDLRAYWVSNPVLVGVQRRGTAPMSVLNDLLVLNTDDGSLAINARYITGSTNEYKVSISAMYGGERKFITFTGSGYYISQTDRQRINTTFILVDINTGKAATFSNAEGTYLTSDSISAPTGNPNPNGVGVTSDGLPIAVAPTYFAVTDSNVRDYTLVLQSPYLVDAGPITPVKDLDPYADGGFSDVGGGTGTFDNTGDNIDFPADPTLSSVDTGFITLYNPSKSQLKSLANYMWSTGFDLDTFKKLFANPMDAILGMSIVPVAVPNGGNKEVKVGNISTGIQMNEAASQFVTVDCGSLNVQEYWGAYLDYSPYTKAEIYLPYIGIHSISVDDIMGKTVHVKYKVDILSGACCAYVKCGGSILYSFVGQCSCSIPITGNDWTNVVNGALSIAASIGSMVATGGASAPMSTAAIASTAVNAMKPNVEKSGSMGGMGGMMGVQKPYLILTRPRQALPREQSSYMGYPSFVTVSLDDLEGYTEVESIHLENINATQQELNEIESLLKNGVIF